MRTVLVTGANKGIGLAVVRRCLIDFEDVRCVMACRSTKRGEAARKKLISKNAAWGNRTYVLSMDQSSDESVKAAEETWAKTGFGGGEGGEKEIYAVVNNAGIASGSAEVILNVNVRGVKRVCDAFLKYVDKTNGRITMMSSGAGPGCVERCSSERQPFFLRDDVTWKDIEEVIDEAEGLEKAGKRLEDAGLSQLIGGAYGLSKALLNSYTMYLARENPSLKINACSPGMVNTDILHDFIPWWLPGLATFLGAVVMPFIALTPDKGTKSTMHLLFADLEGNGRFYGSDAKRSPLDKMRSPGEPEFTGK